MSRQSSPGATGHQEGTGNEADAGPEAVALPEVTVAPAEVPGRRDVLRALWRSRTGPVDGLRDAGMATAEYAIVTLAAAGFGGLLIVLLRSDEVRGLLAGLVRGALTP